MHFPALASYLLSFNNALTLGLPLTIQVQAYLNTEGAGGISDHPQYLVYTLPDLFLSMVSHTWCPSSLVSRLRAPHSTMQHFSCLGWPSLQLLLLNE